MKKVYYILLALAIVACKNGRQATAISEEQAKKDSIAMAMEADSIEREQIFEARGDTIFGQVRFGMSLKEAQTSADAFVHKFEKNNTGYFEFAGFKFMDFSFENIEEMEVNFLPTDWNLNRLYKGKLYSTQWVSFIEHASDIDEISQEIEHLISFFENKYGKCSEKNIYICSNFGKYVNGNRVYADGVIAKWETSKRIIRFDIEETVERNDFYEKQGMPFQYKIKILFVDKNLEKEASKYIDEVVQRKRDEYNNNKQKQDSISMLNAL